MTQVLPDPNKFYRSLLAMGKLQVSEEGLVFELTADDRLPFFVSDKRLVIPEPPQLKASITSEERIFFQAARENIMLGETKEFAAFRRRVNDQMQIKIMAIIAELLVIAGSPKLHSKLKGAQLDLLRGLEEVDKATFEAYKGLLKVTSEGDATQQPFSLYLAKNGKLGDSGKAYRRLATVSFPLYEQLVKDGLARDDLIARRKEQSKEHREELTENATFGVKLGKHGRQIFTKLFEYIFPLITQKDAYSRGSNSDYFPYLEAFCYSMQAVAESINTVVDAFVEMVPTLGYHRIDLEWVEAIANPEGLYRAAQRTPDQNMGGAAHHTGQPHNQGAIPIATDLPQVAVPPPQVAQQPTNPLKMGNPHLPLPPAQVGGEQQPAQSGHRIQEKSLSDLFAPRPMPQGQPMMAPGYPQGYPQQYPPGYGQPQNPMFPMPPQQPPRGVYMGGGMPGMPMQQPMQPAGYGYPQQQQQPMGYGQPQMGTTGAYPGVVMGQPPYKSNI